MRDHQIRGRVLLVEDNEGNRNLASWILEKLDYAVELACDGREAVEKFEAGRFDISLFFRRDNAQARVRLVNDWSVRPSRELRERLSEIVGHEGFRFIYKNALSA